MLFNAENNTMNIIPPYFIGEANDYTEHRTMQSQDDTASSCTSVNGNYCHR